MMSLSIHFAKYVVKLFLFSTKHMEYIYICFHWLAISRKALLYCTQEIYISYLFSFYTFMMAISVQQIVHYFVINYVCQLLFKNINLYINENLVGIQPLVLKILSSQKV